MAVEPIGHLDEILRETVSAIVCRHCSELGASELIVFLTCYLGDHPQTVRELAGELDASISTITQTLNRLGDAGLLRPQADPKNRRSALIARTTKGAAFLRELRGIVIKTAANAEKGPGKG